MKKNITRENVNSFESNVEDVVAYLTDLLTTGEEPTVFETFAMGWIGTISPRFEKLFNSAMNRVHVQNHVKRLFEGVEG
ncbi:TPA: hypothetical protein OTR57_001527 [Acinetobacter baumannii]|nr:hypothetical protein [Acinetobacter baumannii]